MNPQRPDPDPQAQSEAGGERERLHAGLRKALSPGPLDATSYFERAGQTRNPRRFREYMDQMIDALHQRDRELIRQAEEHRRCQAAARRGST